MDDPDFLALLKKNDLDSLYLNSDDYLKNAKRDYERIGKLVRRLGLQKK